MCVTCMFGVDRSVYLFSANNYGIFYFGFLIFKIKRNVTVHTISSSYRKVETTTTKVNSVQKILPPVDHLEAKHN